ncbi:MAG TPA: hypothetical protein VIK35_08715 [Verrucomicrobiae bacterium]
MQFSKFRPLVCAAVFCAGFIYVHAQDNPAQAAARASLDAKMRALDAQQGSTNMAAPPSDTAAQAKAMEALQEKMAELDAQQKVSSNVTAPPAVADTAAQARAMEALQEKMAELDAQQKAETTAASSSSDNAAQTAARAALENKLRELNAQQAAMNAGKLAAAAPVQSPVIATPPASANYPGKELGLPPITAPPLPISAAKDSQLQALLAKYLADQVTAAEYQSNRAEILAEP